MDLDEKLCGKIDAVASDLEDLEETLHEKIEEVASDLEDTNTALTTLETRLDGEIDAIESDLSDLEDEVEALESEVEDLKSKQVVEDKFFVNENPFPGNERYNCYDTFTVTAGNTIDLAANFTLQSVSQATDAVLRIRLE